MVHLTIRNEGIRRAYTHWTSNFIIEVDKAYQYDPIAWECPYVTDGRESWEINMTLCLQ